MDEGEDVVPTRDGVEDDTCTVDTAEVEVTEVVLEETVGGIYITCM